eukprot:1142805-Prymnesium_polylepis.1
MAAPLPDGARRLPTRCDVASSRLRLRPRPLLPLPLHARRLARRRPRRLRPPASCEWPAEGWRAGRRAADAAAFLARPRGDALVRALPLPGGRADLLRRLDDLPVQGLPPRLLGPQPAAAQLRAGALLHLSDAAAAARPLSARGGVDGALLADDAAAHVDRAARGQLADDAAVALVRAQRGALRQALLDRAAQTRAAARLDAKVGR